MIAQYLMHVTTANPKANIQQLHCSRCFLVLEKNYHCLRTDLLYINRAYRRLSHNALFWNSLGAQYEIFEDFFREFWPKITLLEHIEHAGLNLSVAIFFNRFLGYSEESGLLGKFFYNTDDIKHEFHGT